MKPIISQAIRDAIEYNKSILESYRGCEDNEMWKPYVDWIRGLIKKYEALLK